MTKQMYKPIFCKYFDASGDALQQLQVQVSFAIEDFIDTDNTDKLIYDLNIVKSALESIDKAFVLHCEKLNYTPFDYQRVHQYNLISKSSDAIIEYAFEYLLFVDYKLTYEQSFKLRSLISATIRYSSEKLFTDEQFCELYIAHQQ